MLTTSAIDPRLVTDVKAAEACSLLAYKDTRGYWTIGWGHLIPNQTISWKGHSESQDQADADLDIDLEDAMTFAQNLSEYAACDTACRQNALTELCFNLHSRWMGFVKCRAAWLRQDWGAARDELLNSAWAAQVGPTRANRIAGYVLTGQYP